MKEKGLEPTDKDWELYQQANPSEEETERRRSSSRRQCTVLRTRHPIALTINAAATMRV